jgi:hypothetical protein
MALGDVSDKCAHWRGEIAGYRRSVFSAWSIFIGALTQIDGDVGFNPQLLG